MGHSNGEARDAVRIARVEAFAYRAPISRPVVTSFGVMRDRPAVFVRIEDGDGAFGWGEVFANWPAAGAEHRARLMIEDIGPLVIGQSFARPDELFERLSRQTRVRALQCGEEGPFRQCIAGLDVAFHDLLARRAGIAVARLIEPGAPLRVPVYASGIFVLDAPGVVPRMAGQGYGRFKLKVGFDPLEDVRGVEAAKEFLAPGQALMLDANQAWTIDQALEMVPRLGTLGPLWIEEPIIADAPIADWQHLADASPVPLAGGENVTGEQAFADVARLGHLGVIQPDLAKWGGLTGCLRAAQAARRHGRLMCPHFLGGGLGLVASAHFLAAAGGDGMLEVDVNPNPLREAFLEQGTVADGAFRLSDAPGLGVQTLPEPIERFRSWHGEAA